MENLGSNIYIGLALGAWKQFIYTVMGRRAEYTGEVLVASRKPLGKLAEALF